MKLFDIIHNFMLKAKQEAARECHVAPAAGGEDSNKMPKGWVGMDLDGTLARSDTPWGIARIGEPVPQMVALLKKMLADRVRVKIFTARASDPEQVVMIHAWLEKQGIPPLEVTNVKDFDMIRVYDDRAIQVITDRGIIVETPPTLPSPF